MVMRIKELREERGLPAQGLANSMGVTAEVVTLWENEVVLPKTRDLSLLARVLGCRIGQLFVEEVL